MFFCEEFIDSIRTNPLSAVIRICDNALHAVSHMNQNEWDAEQAEILGIPDERDQ